MSAPPQISVLLSSYSVQCLAMSCCRHMHPEALRRITHLWKNTSDFNIQVRLMSAVLTAGSQLWSATVCVARLPCDVTMNGAGQSTAERVSYDVRRLVVSRQGVPQRQGGILHHPEFPGRPCRGCLCKRETFG